ncbi:MAG: permease [Bacteroidales bacterium]|jgi:uncharacterized membrane protein YraQ (UPF0718 family)|nr:permease [Bacteroidales bacterium]
MQYITPFLLLLNEMSPYLLLGFLIAGLLKVFVPREKYIGQIARPNFRSVLWAALAGVPLPLCSCGVIPTGMSLRKEGASKGATVAFLISTPQTGVDSIAATGSLLGLPFAIIRPVAAFITGLAGGFATNRLDKTVGESDIINSEDGNDSLDKSKIARVFHYAFVEMLQNIGKWLLAGILIAGLIAIFLPDDIFTTFLSNPLLNMLLVLAIAVPTYTCATGSIPMAAVLMMKGLSPGAALVFLMAGPATSIASITVLGKMLGRKTLLIYLASIIAGAMLFGLAIDYLLPASWFGMNQMNHDLMHHTHHHAFSVFPSICSILLVLLIINAFIRKYIDSRAVMKHSATAKTYKIGGMTCNHCKATVEKNLARLEGVASVHVDLSKGIAYVEGTPDDDEVKKTVTAIGFEYNS